MSKSGKKKSIYYNPSSVVTINGQNKAGVNISANGTSGYYNMDDDEKAAYEYAGEQFALNLPNVNVFDSDTKRSLNNQVNAYINQGIEDINDIYTPMLQELQNDIASRFGNLDNSVFMDNLSDIENSRAGAISDFARDVQTYRQDIIENELNNRYDYLDFLNNYRGQVLSNALNSIDTGRNLSNLSNSYYSTLNGIQNTYNQSGGNISNLVSSVADIVSRIF